MKKRALSIMLSLFLCLTMLSNINTSTVFAAEDTTVAQATGQNFSNWAMFDLMEGDTYGIYPLSWYTQDMTAPVSRNQLKSVVAEVRKKILKTDAVTNNVDQVYLLDKTVSVEKVLDTFYKMLSGFEFTTDLGIKNTNAVDFMTKNGVFTGTNGELALKDTCSIEQTCVFATRIITLVFDKLDAGSKGFLWEAKSGTNTVYLLGSIHLASSDIYPLDKEILKAYQASNALAVELNIFDVDGSQKVNQLGTYTDGTTLKDHVSEATYKKTIELAAKYGYPEDLIAMCKPWYIYISFAALTSTDSAQKEDAAVAATRGIDYHFITDSLVKGKPVLEVEGYLSQGMMLDSFSANLGEFLLNSTIDEINDVLAGKSNEGADSLDEMLQLWHEGDVDTFKKLMSMETEYPEIYGQDAAATKAILDEFTLKLFTQRDVKMADYIDKLLKGEGSSTYFVIVGSGHYISNHSVIDILKDKGYTITQIK